MYSWIVLESPLGKLTAIANEDSIVRLAYEGYLEDIWKPVLDTPSEKNFVLYELSRQLEEYWARQREVFDLPLVRDSLTDFADTVLHECASIEYAQTITYSELAVRAGNEKAVRAVGSALGKNPWPIIVPCHRVVHSDGRNAAYTGGIERKQFLLSFEQGQ